MTKEEKLKIIKILRVAFAEARETTQAYLDKHPDSWYPCGFAWVRLEGRSPVVSVLKESFDENSRGHKGYPKGWEIWNPSGHGTQCMDAKMAGARVFAERLTNAGYKCYADCRMD